MIYKIYVYIHIYLYIPRLALVNLMRRASATVSYLLFFFKSCSRHSRVLICPSHRSKLLPSYQCGTWRYLALQRGWDGEGIKPRLLLVHALQ